MNLLPRGLTSSISVSPFLVLLLAPTYDEAVFELVSAYGTVGLSLGVPYVSIIAQNTSEFF